MTSTTAQRLTELNDQGRAAFIGYLPVGFPSVDASIDAAKALIDSGVDILELGVPYSDPVMDGPVIQRAVEAALDQGTHLSDTFRAVAELSESVPVLVMTYWNPVFHYGVEAFARDLANAGGAGLITPDLIPDEASDWLQAAERHDLDRVFLVAPSSRPERLARTAAACRGFTYAASTMGVTGTKAEVGTRAKQLVADTRAAGADHVCVGLGVSTAEQAREVASYADGVIVGTALIRPMLATDDVGAGRRQMQAIARDLADGVWRHQ